MTHKTQTIRNLRALFVLAAILCSIAIGGGALVLSLGYSHPEVTQPMWKFGQGFMFVGLLHSGIYCGIYFQMRAIRQEANAKMQAQPGPRE